MTGNIYSEKTAGKRMLSIAVIIVMTLTILACIGQRPEESHASSAKYWLKVNKKANVVTAYKYINGKYRPYRAMLCSSGGHNTPSGTFHTLKKYRWKVLMGPVYGQYNTRIYAHYLFHSVWYYNNYNKATCTTTEYNLLGHSRSHGCVRLCVMDAKWIYENCKIGTKVTVYSSSDPGPLGKPKGFKIYGGMAWDPTDPDPDNPDFRLRKPVLKISKHKKDRVQYGSKYDVMSGVSAKNVNAYQDLTDKVRVYKVRKYKDGKWRKAKFSTRSVGTYKLYYGCRDKYCRGVAKKKFKIKVVDTSKPAMKTPGNRVIKLGTRNAVYKVTARQKSGSRTKYIKVRIKNPAGKVMHLSYAKAKRFKFGQQGTYRIRYKVRTVSSPYRYTSKSIRVKCWKNASITVNKKKIKFLDSTTQKNALYQVKKNTLIKDGFYEYKGGKATITFSKKAPFTAGDVISVTLEYRGLNGNRVTKTVKITVQEIPAPPEPEPQPEPEPSPAPGEPDNTGTEG